jgi:capsular polysaccharide biosynthesis protein
MPVLSFLEPQQFCLSNGGTFEVVRPFGEVGTESYFSHTNAFLGYRVDYPAIGIGRVGQVRLWNDNFGVFKDDTYLLDTPAIVAGEFFYQVYRPHGITFADEAHMTVPDEITRSAPKKIPGEYVLLGTALGNHSHMLDILTKCLLVQDHLDEQACSFVIDADSEKYMEIINRYFPGEAPSYFVLEKDTLYEFETLVIPSSLQSWPVLHPLGGELIQKKNALFIDYGQASKNGKIYIDRGNASRRRVANGEEMEDVLSAHGVVPLSLEEKSFAEQIEIFKNASLIIGQHGAGMANAIFSRPGTRIVELMGYNHLMNFTHSAFWYSFQATALDHLHRSIVCENVPGPEKAPKNMDIAVNPQELDVVLRGLSG